MWSSRIRCTTPLVASLRHSNYRHPLYAQHHHHHLLLLPCNLVVLRTLVSRTMPVFNNNNKDGEKLPYHLIVGLPALSPTMDSGALAEWYLNEGDSFAAGDALAKIETDKASMDFEAQDDGYVAKILVQAGQGQDSK